MFPPAADRVNAETLRSWTDGENIQTEDSLIVCKLLREAS